jgi:hypothetical protein
MGRAGCSSLDHVIQAALACAVLAWEVDPVASSDGYGFQAHGALLAGANLVLGGQRYCTAHTREYVAHFKSTPCAPSHWPTHSLIVLYMPHELPLANGCNDEWNCSKLRLWLLAGNSPSPGLAWSSASERLEQSAAMPLREARRWALLLRLDLRWRLQPSTVGVSQPVLLQGQTAGCQACRAGLTNAAGRHTELGQLIVT